MFAPRCGLLPVVTWYHNEDLEQHKSSPFPGARTMINLKNLHIFNTFRRRAVFLPPFPHEIFRKTRLLPHPAFLVSSLIRRTPVTSSSLTLVGLGCSEETQEPRHGHTIAHSFYHGPFQPKQDT